MFKLANLHYAHRNTQNTKKQTERQNTHGNWKSMETQGNKKTWGRYHLTALNSYKNMHKHIEAHIHQRTFRTQTETNEKRT